MNWFRRMSKQWLGKSKPLPKVIIVGIDTHCYQLGQALIEHQDAEIVAFIDDEPWTNRTELLGAKVHYPSDMAALVERRAVALIIDFDDSTLVPSSIKDGLKDLSVKRLCLVNNGTQSLSEWREQVLEQLNQRLTK